MGKPESFDVEVAYARPDKQRIVVVAVRPGSTAIEAVRQSGIAELFPEIDLEHCELGVFGRSVKRDDKLQSGDRVEIYRPLKADPREVRRRLATEGKTMGRTRLP